MTKDVYTVNDYLIKLKGLSSAKICRPFDTNYKEIVEFGPEATKLILPKVTIEDFTPPTADLIKKIYQCLLPVLNELEDFDEFDGNANYGSLEAKDISKAYLFNAINKEADHSKQLITKQDAVYHVFLRDVSDALVEQIEMNDLPEYLANRNKSALDSILSYCDLEDFGNTSLSDYFLKNGDYVKAYKASVLSNHEVNNELAHRLKPHLNSCQDLIKEKQSSFKMLFFRGGAMSSALACQNDDVSELENIFNGFTVIMDRLDAINSKKLAIDVLSSMRESTFFNTSIPYFDKNSKKREIMTCVSDLKSALAKACLAFDAPSSEEECLHDSVDSI